MNDILVSKKFIFALVVSVFSLVLVAMDKVTAVEGFAFVSAIGLTYVIGNISDKINDSSVEKESIKVNGKDSL